MTDLCDSLHLDIIQCSCVCGNKWTHSHTWLASRAHGYLGGSPTPLQMEKLQYHSYTSKLWNVNGCHRCVPLQLSEGWTKPLIAPTFDRVPSERAKARVEAEQQAARITAAEQELLA